jgi:hypothetical protein
MRVGMTTEEDVKFLGRTICPSRTPESTATGQRTRSLPSPSRWSAAWWLPGGSAAVWVSPWVWVAHVGLMVFLGLLFPDGRLPSRRWRPLVWSVVTVAVVGTVAMALSPGPIDGLGPIQNPLGIEGVPNFDALLTALSYALALVAAASLLLRFPTQGEYSANRSSGSPTLER